MDEAPLTRQERERVEAQARQTHRKRQAQANGQASVIDAFNRAHSIDAILEGHGYSKGRTGRYVRLGGKSESVSVKDGRSYHWSSNDTLSDGKAHDAFDVYAHFEHGGDGRAAVKAAAELLGISRAPAVNPIRETAIPVTIEPYRAFPVDALPPVMERFAGELARTLCVDPAMAAMPMLSVAGAAVGNAARARMSADYHAPANIWSAVVVRSGERKSPVLRSIMAPIYARQHEAAERYAQEVAEYERELERWRERPRKDRGDSPLQPGAYPHFYLADTTTEAITTRLATQPRGLPVVLDELAGFFAGMNQYRAKGGNDRESYLAFYDAGAAKIDRKSATPPTIFIPRAFVAVCGMIQPGALARALGPAEFDSGLAARFLLAAPPAQRAAWTDAGVVGDVRDAWRDLLHGLLDMPLPEHPALIPPSDAAMSLWADAHDRLEGERHDERDDRVRAARAKLIGAIPRLSLILQYVSAASGERFANVRFIDELSMQRAIDLAKWFTRETRRVYGLLTDEGSEGDIIARIEANGGSVSGRELMRWSREFKTAALAESYLNSLVRDGMGRWTWRQTSGRPSRVFTLLDSADADESHAGATKNRGSVSVSAVSGRNDAP